MRWTVVFTVSCSNFIFKLRCRKGGTFETVTLTQATHRPLCNCLSFLCECMSECVDNELCRLAARTQTQISSKINRPAKRPRYFSFPVQTLQCFSCKHAVYASSQSCLHCQECLSTSRVARRRNLYPTISVVHYGFRLSRHPGIEWPLIVLFEFKHIYV